MTRLYYTMPQNLYFTPRNDIMIRVDFFNELFFSFGSKEFRRYVGFYDSHYLCTYLYHYYPFIPPDIVFVLNNITIYNARCNGIIRCTYPQQLEKW